MRLWHVPACKMEPQSGNIFSKKRPDPTSQSSLRTCFCFQCCVAEILSKNGVSLFLGHPVLWKKTVWMGRGGYIQKQLNICFIYPQIEKLQQRFFYWEGV